MTDTKIVGIGGLVRSGKDMFADMLIEQGWFGVSFGDIIRGYARQRHADKPDPISVANMTDTSNWLRTERGADAVLQEALAQYEEASKTKEYEGLVLWSVRAPIEVDWILERGGALIWLEADDQVRYERDRKSRREGEAEISFEEFKRQEALQFKPMPGIPPEVQMDLMYVKSHATNVLENNGNSLETFLEKAHSLIDEISRA